MRDILLIIHFIGLAMGLGTSIGYMFLGMAGSKLEKGEQIKFQLNIMALGRMGHIGLVLLVISGIGLMPPYWSILPTSPLLIAKLVLVMILGTLIVIITSKGNKAQLGDTAAQLKKIEPIGKIALLTGIIIVILAVYIFH